MFLNISSVQSKVLRPGDFDHSTIRKFLLFALYFSSKTSKMGPLIDQFWGPLKREKSNLTAG